MWPFGYKYDVFISHAVEDKIPIANELCRRLENAKLRVWYSGKELTVGDSLEKTIHKGLDQSRYGVVILSPTYLEKNWTIREFYILLGKEIDTRKVILPVLYNITAEELLLYDIRMGDKIAVPFAKGMDYVIERLVAVIKAPPPVHVRALQWLAMLCLFACLLFVSLFGYRAIDSAKPDATFVRQTVEARIDDFEKRLEHEFKKTSSSLNFVPATSADVIGVFSTFQKLESYYRNEYEFTNGLTRIRFKKHVQPALKIEFDDYSPYNDYNFIQPRILLTSPVSSEPNATISCVYINTQPVTYAITSEEKTGKNDYKVSVTYTNYIRYWTINLSYPGGPSLPKRTQILIQGFLPKEEFVFRRNGYEWALANADN